MNTKILVVIIVQSMFIVFALGFIGRDFQQAQLRAEETHRRQLADIVRFVQGDHRTQIQQAGIQVRTPPIRPNLDQPWARTMDEWYRDRGLAQPPENDRFRWHEQRLDALEAVTRSDGGVRPLTGSRR